MEFLHREDVLSLEAVPAGLVTDNELCMQAYELDMRQTQGLAPAISWGPFNTWRWVCPEAREGHDHGAVFPSLICLLPL